MLRAIPQSIFSWNFSLVQNDAEVARLTLPWQGERGTLDFNGVECRLYREGYLTGDFIMESEGISLARATKPSAFTRRFEVECDRQNLYLAAQSPFTRAFSVRRNDRKIGVIYPKHWLARSATIDLPDEIALPAKAFLFWLVVLMWRRAAKSN